VWRQEGRWVGASRPAEESSERARSQQNEDNQQAHFIVLAWPACMELSIIA